MPDEINVTVSVPQSVTILPNKLGFGAQVSAENQRKVSTAPSDKTFHITFDYDPVDALAQGTNKTIKEIVEQEIKGKYPTATILKIEIYGRTQ